MISRMLLHGQPHLLEEAINKAVALEVIQFQGYLANKKHPPRTTLQ